MIKHFINFCSSAGSGLLTKTVFAGKQIMVFATTTYVGASSTVSTPIIPEVHFEWYPIIFNEGTVTVFAILGSILGFLATWFLQGILEDPEAPLTIKLKSAREFVKFKPKPKPKL